LVHTHNLKDLLRANLALQDIIKILKVQILVFRVQLVNHLVWANPVVMHVQPESIPIKVMLVVMHVQLVHILLYLDLVFVVHVHLVNFQLWENQLVNRALKEHTLIQGCHVSYVLRELLVIAN